MSGPLPEKLADWPEDPYKLLNVDRSATDDDIRRAYTRLIRHYKPEHYPAEFQRLREAVEACRNRVQWQRHLAEASTEDRVFEPKIALAESASDGVAEAWQRAVDGRLFEAYQQIAAKCHESDTADSPLRLYWLFALEPNLDREKSRHDWLAEALRRSRLAGPPAELYRRELELDPGVCWHDSYARILDANATVWDVAAIGQAQLSALAKHDLSDVIMEQLGKLKHRLGIDGEPHWLGLVSAAAEWACWEEGDRLYEYCQSELDQLRHWELKQGYYFDRIDHAQFLASQFRKPSLPALPRAVLDLIRLAVCVLGSNRPDQYRRAAEQLAAIDYERLAHMLHWYDEGGAEIARTLANILETGFEHDSSDYPAGFLRAQMRVFHRVYPVGRGALIDWLVRDGIHPRELVDALSDDPDTMLRMKAGAIREDQTLRILWLARMIADQ